LSRANAAYIATFGRIKITVILLTFIVRLSGWKLGGNYSTSGWNNAVFRQFRGDAKTARDPIPADPLRGVIYIYELPILLIQERGLGREHARR
jgi:hypothetical protein